MVFKPFVAALGLAACLTVAAPLHAGTFSYYASDPSAYAIVNTGPASDPNVFQLASSNPAGYAGLYYDAITDSPPLTPATLTTLSALYEMQIGTFSAGAARFSLSDTTNNPANEAYIYWGTPQSNGTFTDPNSGSFASTGNLADLTSSDLRVQVNGFGGDSTGQHYETWSQFVANDGNVQIAYISLDLDAGYSQPNGQQMITNEFTVNGNVDEAGPAAAAPEPASFTLLSVGLALVGGYRLRRRKV